MKQFRIHFVSILTVCFFVGSLALKAQTSGLDAIQQRLLSEFRLTAITADRLGIVTTGSTVQLHRDGMLMYSVAAPGAASNTYKNGKISLGGGGFAKGFLIAATAPGGLEGGGYPARRFVPGENCWVTGITVQKDGIVFKLYSDPYFDLRYYGNLKIPFPEKNVTPPVDQVLALVAEVLSAVPAQDQSAPANMQNALPTQAVAYQEIAPPAPLPAPSPTITVGMTKEQVTTGFGEPARKAVAGSKEIFVYTDMKMKITFTDGIVSEID